MFEIQYLPTFTIFFFKGRNKAFPTLPFSFHLNNKKEAMSVLESFPKDFISGSWKRWTWGENGVKLTKIQPVILFFLIFFPYFIGKKACFIGNIGPLSIYSQLYWVLFECVTNGPLWWLQVLDGLSWRPSRWYGRGCGWSCMVTSSVTNGLSIMMSSWVEWCKRDSDGLRVTSVRINESLY